MAKHNTRGVSNGELQKTSQQKTSSSRDSSKTKNKKHVKSNITNKKKSTRSNTAASAVGMEGEDDEADSSETEAGDVFTLSSARELDDENATRRLAGNESEDEEMIEFWSTADTIQAIAGAEDDGAISDDNGYAGVENVSDSEDSDGEHESNILRSAEEDLINEFERHEEKLNANTMMHDMNAMALREDETSASQLDFQKAGSPLPDLGLDIDLNSDPFYGLAQNDTLYADLWNEAESAIWRRPETMGAREGSDPSGTNQKKVRFEEITHSRRSSSSSSEDANDTFPDLFAPADDPAVQRQLALGLEFDGGLQMDFDDAESCYDFDGEDEKLAFELDEESDSDEDVSSADSDDEGDTTDEETPEEQIARMQELRRAAGKEPIDTTKTPKRPTSSGAATPGTPRPVTPKEFKAPRSGTFAVEPHRAVMSSDPKSKQIKMFPPKQPTEKEKAFWERAKTANSSRNNSPSNSCLTLPSPGPDNMPARPFTAESTLGSMFNGNLEILRNNDVAGIAEDMFPQVMQSSQASITTPATEDSDMDFKDVNMGDFIDMDGSESESDRPQSASITSPGESDMYNSFTSENGQIDGAGSGLLGHFDLCRGTIGSFRQNQNQAKYLSSLSSNPVKRASTHEYNALQKGRRGAANTPITPARKKRASQDLTQSAGIRKNMNSPLASRRPRSRGNSLVNGAVSNGDIFQTLTRSPFE